MSIRCKNHDLSTKNDRIGSVSAGKLVGIFMLLMSYIWFTLVFIYISHENYAFALFMILAAYLTRCMWNYNKILTMEIALMGYQIQHITTECLMTGCREVEKCREAISDLKALKGKYKLIVNPFTNLKPEEYIQHHTLPGFWDSQYAIAAVGKKRAKYYKLYTSM